MAYFNGKQIWDAKILPQESYDKGYKDGSREGYSQGYNECIANESMTWYDNGYGKGYIDGNDTGIAQGKAEGFSEGYNAGHTQGKSEGWNDGYEAGENVGYSNGTKDGYSHGKAEGEEIGQAEGYARGYADGEDVGKEVEWNAFWDALQENGKRVNYSYLFSGKGWNDNNFKPKYDIVPNGGSTAYGMNSAFYTTGITDLAAALERAGVILDTSNERQLNYAFGYSALTHIPTISLVSATTATNRIFYYNANLKTIDKVIVTENNTYAGWFNNSPALENITFEGVIGNSLDVSPCPLLTAESVKSIVDHLVIMGFDNSGWGTKDLTVSRIAWDKFEAAFPFPENEPANTPANTPDWATYVTYIGWNLVLV